MTTERDIIIERLEQKLAARDKEIEEMKDELRDSVIQEMEKRFSDKLRLRESAFDDTRTRFGEKVNEIMEMNKAIRDSVLVEQKARDDTIKEVNERISRIERRLMELNSSYDGVMKELLDQKSRIREITPKLVEKEKTVPVKEEPVEETKPPEKPKTEYIIAENKPSRENRKQQKVIEAEETEVPEEKNIPETPERPAIRKIEKVNEGVEIVETLKKR